MTSIYQSLVSAGQQVGGFVADSVDQVQGSIEQLQRDSEALENSSLPGTPEKQAKIGKICDAGYGQFFVDAYELHFQGKAIHPCSINVLSLFELA